MGASLLGRRCFTESFKARAFGVGRALLGRHLFACRDYHGGSINMLKEATALRVSGHYA